jgi:chromosome partitioning protein
VTEQQQGSDAETRSSDADVVEFPPPFRRPAPRVMTVANQKGGVGKTTTAVNLAAALGEMGWKTLVIDLDPQANASTALGLELEKIEHSTYDVLLQGATLDECIVSTEFDNLSIAPATVDLAGAEVELVPALSREMRLKQALEPIGDRYDYVFVDCPPSLGLLTINGLTAAREILLPIQCEYFALEGVGQLVQNVQLVKAHLNPALEISTVVLTMYDARTKLSFQVAADVRNYFDDRVCKTVIPRSVRLSEAPSYGQPITVFDPLSRGALAYQELAKEISDGDPS